MYCFKVSNSTKIFTSYGAPNFTFKGNTDTVLYSVITVSKSGWTFYRNKKSLDELLQELNLQYLVCAQLKVNKQAQSNLRNKANHYKTNYYSNNIVAYKNFRFLKLMIPIHLKFVTIAQWFCNSVRIVLFWESFTSLCEFSLSFIETIIFDPASWVMQSLIRLPHVAVLLLCHRGVGKRWSPVKLYCSSTLKKD